MSATPSSNEIMEAGRRSRLDSIQSDVLTAVVYADFGIRGGCGKAQQTGAQYSSLQTPARTWIGHRTSSPLGVMSLTDLRRWL
jgi:hypothetical protein